MLDVSGVSLCSLPLLLTDLQRNNLWQATALYQNTQDCIASLATAASLSFVSEAASGQNVCVDQVQLLPSSILQPGAVVLLVHSFKLWECHLHCSVWLAMTPQHGHDCYATVDVVVLALCRCAKQCIAHSRLPKLCPWRSHIPTVVCATTANQ